MMLYTLGILVIVLSYGAWYSLTTSEDSEQYGALIFAGVWIWPIALPFMLTLYLGYWLCIKIKEYLR